MTKTVALLSLPCLLVVSASIGTIQALGRVAAELHRGVVALDALVVRVAGVEQDLATMSEDVTSIADEASIIDESLAPEEDDTEGGEAVGLERPAALRSARRLTRDERARRREGRLGRLATIADGRAVRQRAVRSGPSASH